MANKSRLLDLTGDKALSRELMKLPKRAERKVLRPSIGFALTPVVKQTKQNVPKDHGFLAQEIGKKVSGSKAWGKVYVKDGVYSGGDIGTTQVKKGLGGLFGKTTTVDKKIKPANYAHLVEFGTKYTKATNFMRSAMGSKKNEVVNRMAMKTRQNLNKLKAKDL